MMMRCSSRLVVTQIKSAPGAFRVCLGNSIRALPRGALLDEYPFLSRGISFTPDRR